MKIKQVSARTFLEKNTRDTDLIYLVQSLTLSECILPKVFKIKILLPKSMTGFEFFLRPPTKRSWMAF